MKKKIVGLVTAGALMVSCVFVYAEEVNIFDIIKFKDNGVELTLDKAVEITMKDSPTIKQANIDIDKSEVTYKKYRRLASKGIDAYKNKDSASYLEAVTLNRFIADYAKECAQRNYTATVESVKADVEKAYYELLQVQDLVRINEQNLNTSKDLYEKSKQKFDLGLINKQELINSELSYIEAENAYTEAQTNLIAAKMTFNNLVGYDLFDEVKLQGKLEPKELPEVELEVAIASALEKRNEIKALEFNYETNKTLMEVTSRRYPSNTIQYKEQDIKLQNAEKSFNDIKNTIQIDVSVNYIQLQQKLEKINASKKSVELAAEALRLNQLSYDVGMAVLTDVQQAQTNLLKAELGLSQAILDYNLEVLEFEDSIEVGRTSVTTPE